jgi:hypothetical protein
MLGDAPGLAAREEARRRAPSRLLLERRACIEGARGFEVHFFVSCHLGAPTALSILAAARF